MSATESISKKLFDALSAALPAIKIAGDRGYAGDLYQQAMDAVTEYVAGPQQEAERRWVMRVVVVSNEHLHEESFHSFLEDKVDDVHQGAAIFRCDEGFIVRVIDADEDAPEDYPVELVEALNWARTQGYTHVRFDPDGDFVPMLQEFEW